MKEIAYCGNDCNSCPRYIATQIKDSVAKESSLKKVADLWYRLGWREKLPTTEEIRCNGCHSATWCRYEIKECCEKKGINNCGECPDYLCAKIVNAFNKGILYAPKCREAAAEDPELQSQLCKAFFCKPENLACIRSLEGLDRTGIPQYSQQQKENKEKRGEKLPLTFEKLKSNKDAPMDLLLLADPSRELVSAYLEKGVCYIARLKEELVAEVLVLETLPFQREFINVAVKEEYQNRGIGKRILRYVIGELKKEGVKVIEIGTGNPGVAQMLLYQKCGFRIIGVDLDFFRRTHPERIFENGIECRDMIRMRIDFFDQSPNMGNEEENLRR